MKFLTYKAGKNYKVGVLQGGYIVKTLGLDKGKKGPFNVELFAGSPDDNNATFFWNGAMSTFSMTCMPDFFRSAITLPAFCAFRLRW